MDRWQQASTTPIPNPENIAGIAASLPPAHIFPDGVPAPTTADIPAPMPVDTSSSTDKPTPYPVTGENRKRITVHEAIFLEADFSEGLYACVCLL